MVLREKIPSYIWFDNVTALKLLTEAAEVLYLVVEFFVILWRLIAKLIRVIKVNNASNSNEKLYRPF